MVPIFQYSINSMPSRTSYTYIHVYYKIFRMCVFVQMYVLRKVTLIHESTVFGSLCLYFFLSCRFIHSFFILQSLRIVIHMYGVCFALVLVFYFSFSKLLHSFSVQYRASIRSLAKIELLSAVTFFRVVFVSWQQQRHYCR